MPVLNRSKGALPAIMENRVYDYSTPLKMEYLKCYELFYLHFHRGIELGICMGGAGTCCVEGVHQPFQEGDVQIILPFTHHLHRAGDKDIPTSWYWVELDPQEVLSALGIAEMEVFFRRLKEEVAASGILDRERFPRTVVALRRLMKLIVAGEENKTHFREWMGLWFYETFLCFFEESAKLSRILPASETTGVLDPALEEINRCLYEGLPISVENLAQLSQYSVASFRRIFHSTLGCSPQEYITACRIRRAKSLLADSNNSVLDVAYAVGYNNISGFNRAFLRAVGCTPTDYRRVTAMENKERADENKERSGG